VKHFEREEDSGESVGVSSGEYETLWTGSKDQSRAHGRAMNESSEGKAKDRRGRREVRSRECTHFPFTPSL